MTMQSDRERWKLMAEKAQAAEDELVCKCEGCITRVWAQHAPGLGRVVPRLLAALEETERERDTLRAQIERSGA